VHQTGRVKITAHIKGTGISDLYLWWFDDAGRANKRFIQRYNLPAQYRLLQKEVELPDSAAEYRIGFRLPSGTGVLSKFYLDNLDVSIYGKEEIRVADRIDNVNFSKSAVTLLIRIY